VVKKYPTNPSSLFPIPKKEEEDLKPSIFSHHENLIDSVLMDPQYVVEDYLNEARYPPIRG